MLDYLDLNSRAAEEDKDENITAATVTTAVIVTVNFKGYCYSV